MAMERVPYLVGGGFEHSAEVMRSMLAAATSGAEGIVTPGDMKVQPLSVPGTAVRVAPGNALIRNSYGGGQAQTYAARSSSQTEVPIRETGSSGSRADLIVARIDDPTYDGGTFDPNTFEAAKFQVIEGVSSSQKNLSGLGLSYPAIPLARINIPKSTGTITSDMITDLRSVALPRKSRELYVHPLVGDEGEYRLTDSTSDGGYWPNVTSWRVDVPEWAQRVRVIGHIGGVLLPRAGSNAWGRIWVRLGGMSDPDGIDSQATAWSIPADLPLDIRDSWMFGDDRKVPAGMRGRNVTLGTRGRVFGPDRPGSFPTADYLTVLSLDVEFYETAV